ncbi:head GIN domain-containing protein [Mariniflexile ostreae]|uniref:Head GIN domain-containing protein n=1 Tax=Mariniflexile ostreae TaxID=1520892 RepID=A0ABV5FBJ3_9FLAO
MKFLCSLIITLSIPFFVSAQNGIEKSVEAFKEVKVYDLIQVELIKSSENKVVITGQDKDYVLVTNRNGILKIKMSISKLFDGKQTQVKLYYTHLETIDVNEGSEVNSKDTIKQFEIDLKAQEGASIKVDIDVNYANIKAVSGGYITATGQAKKQTVNLLTGGTYKGEAVTTESTEIDIKAAGDAYIKATDQVDIKIRAGGNVFIYGKPKTVNESRVFGGRVSYMD